MQSMEQAPVTTYSVYDLVERWKVTEKTIRTRMDAGEIRFFRIGVQRRVTEAEVRRIESGGNEGEANGAVAPTATETEAADAV